MFTIIAFTICVMASMMFPRLASTGCDVDQMGAITLEGRIRGVEVIGDLACLAAGFDGLRIVDVSNSMMPTTPPKPMTSQTA